VIGILFLTLFKRVAICCTRSKQPQLCRPMLHALPSASLGVPSGDRAMVGKLYEGRYMVIAFPKNAIPKRKGSSSRHHFLLGTNISRVEVDGACLSQMMLQCRATTNPKSRVTAVLLNSYIRDRNRFSKSNIQASLLLVVPSTKGPCFNDIA